MGPHRTPLDSLWYHNILLPVPHRVGPFYIFGYKQVTGFVEHAPVEGKDLSMKGETGRQGVGSH